MTLLILSKISYIDYKQKIIPDKFNLLLTILGIFNLIIDKQNCKNYITITAIIFTVFLLTAIITNGGIGGGDIKLFTALSLVFGIQILKIISLTFLLAGVYVAYLLIVKNQDTNSNVALGPYICAGTIINLLQVYLLKN